MLGMLIYVLVLLCVIALADIGTIFTTNNMGCGTAIILLIVTAATFTAIAFVIAVMYGLPK